jgi:hypothetical protein
MENHVRRTRAARKLEFYPRHRLGRDSAGALADRRIPTPLDRGIPSSASNVKAARRARFCPPGGPPRLRAAISSRARRARGAGPGAELELADLGPGLGPSASAAGTSACETDVCCVDGTD